MNKLPPGTIKFNCDFCNQISHDKKSQYDNKKNHFCSVMCYAAFRKTLKFLPKKVDYVSHETPKPVEVVDAFQIFDSVAKE